MSSLVQDLRYAFRSLLRSPSFTLAAILTLALGIGANTAIFSLVHALLVRPLPYPAGERLGVLWGAGHDGAPDLISIRDFEDWRARNRSFEDLGIVRTQSVNLTGVDVPDRLVGSFVTASTLSILGARPAIGRLLTEEETREGSGKPVAVLSFGAWQDRFGADTQVVGRTLVLNGLPHTVVGVATREFQDAFGAIDVWLPITSSPTRDWFARGNRNIWAIGRLKPGISFASAQADLSAVASQLSREYPATDGDLGALVVPLRESLVGRIRPVLVVVFAFVGIVLLIACANVTSLQLARAMGRRPEISLRAALGAGRGRLIRQTLTESLVLAALGGGASLGVAHAVLQGLVATAPDSLPSFVAIGLDPAALIFCGTTSAFVALLFGTAPALYASRTDLRAALTQRNASPAHRGRVDMRQALVGGELMLSIVLLCGAGLLARSLVALQAVSPGFDARNLLTAEFRLPAAKYGSPEQISTFMTRALAAIRRVPGAREAALVRSIPLSGNWGAVRYAADDQPGLTPATAPSAQQNATSDGAIRAMGMTLREGRDFDEHDRAGSPAVVIVSEELARRAWPGLSAVGRRLRLFGPPDTWATVVGVVANVKQVTLAEPPTPQIYQPMLQAPGIFTSVVVRTLGDPDALAPAVRGALWSVDRDQPVWKVRSMESLTRRDTAMTRGTLLLAASFALLALALAVVGVYGAMSYAVAQRTQEIGIRVALGARSGQIARLVLDRGLRVVGVASALGVVAALGLAPLLKAQLFGVTAFDPLTFVGVPMLLAAVALLACYLPARRAARIDPVVALRAE